MSISGHDGDRHNIMHSQQHIAMQVRDRCVSRARRLQSSSNLPAGVEQRIANLYTPDLSSCWGVECVQVASPAQPLAA